MSKGLGAAQRLMLSALASREAEYGDGAPFYVWAIVDRVYALSPRMQDRQRREKASLAAVTANIRERAAQGDDKAALYLSLTRSMVRMRPSPRIRRSSPFRQTEVRFNPSRVLASLERRNLVRRHAVKGGGSAGLTDEGRHLATLLSVGSALPLHAEAIDA